jgi:hypothetical protein
MDNIYVPSIRTSSSFGNAKPPLASDLGTCNRMPMLLFTLLQFGLRQFCSIVAGEALVVQHCRLGCFYLFRLWLLAGHRICVVVGTNHEALELLEEVLEVEPRRVLFWTG